VIDEAREAISGAAVSVAGAMRVAMIACGLSVLAVLISLAAIVARVRVPDRG
jgi:hypothetical protein